MTAQHTDMTKELFTTIVNEIPFNRMVGLSLQSIEPDHVVMRFDMKQDLIGNFLYGILHGGVISTVLDMAGGTAAMVAAIRKLPEQTMEALATKLGKASTINLNINYMRPGKGEHFIATASVVQHGNKLTFTRMELMNPANEIIALATGTYHIG